MNTLNTLLELVNTLNTSALNTRDEGIAIGLQKARTIVLDRVLGACTDPVHSNKVLEVAMDAVIRTSEALDAYTQQQQLDTAKLEELEAKAAELEAIQEANDNTATDHELDMHLDELMREFKDWNTEAKPLYLDTNEDKFTKELDAFIEQLDKDMQGTEDSTEDDELVGLPKVKYASTNDLGFEAELRKFFEGF